MFEDSRQLESAVAEELYEFARYWLLRKFQFIDAARDEFESVVDPAVWYEDRPALERVEACNLAFTEWLLFEWVYEGGDTLLELYMERRGDMLPPETLARLHEVHDTQYFSRFRIADKDERTGMLVLVDMRSGKRYDVTDSAAAEVARWRDGVLAERIACVGGTWICVGQTHLYDVARPADTCVDGPGAVHPEDVEEGLETHRLSFYLRLVRDVMGVDGRYASSLKAYRHNDRPTGVYLEDPEDEL